MGVRRPSIPVECDYCDASYECTDGVLRIRPGWREIASESGEKLIVCPRHKVTVSARDFTAEEAEAELREEATKAARRAGVRIERTE